MAKMIKLTAADTDGTGDYSWWVCIGPGTTMCENDGHGGSWIYLASEDEKYHVRETPAKIMKLIEGRPDDIRYATSQDEVEEIHQVVVDQFLALKRQDGSAEKVRNIRTAAHKVSLVDSAALHDALKALGLESLLEEDA